MVRFDIVVANRDRTEVFWKGWSSFKNFDVKQDRIVFLNTSHDPMRELAICRYYLDLYGISECNFVFLVRRSWNSVFGMIADYTRLVGEGVMTPANYAFFMQDHYVCKTEFVAGDTLPENAFLDFDEMNALFKTDQKLVMSSGKYGFRLISAVPEELSGKDFESYDGLDGLPKEGLPWIFMPGKLGSILNEKYSTDHFIYYHGGYHIKGATDIGIAFDGLNFCCDPKYIVNHYQKNKHLYFAGMGDYGEALVWEARIGKILYDQGLGFYELSRKVMVKNTEELKKLDPNPGTVVDKTLWNYFYTSPLFYAFHHGDDVWPYRKKKTEAYDRYQTYCDQYEKIRENELRIFLIYDSEPGAVNFNGHYRTDLPELFVNKMLKSATDLEKYSPLAVKSVLLYRRVQRGFWNPLKKRFLNLFIFPKRVIRKLKRMLN